MTTVREGTVRWRDRRTWYRVVGEAREPARLPLLALHGAEGATHAVLRPLEDLAGRRRRVVLYDQAGCGRSDPPGVPADDALSLRLDELAEVRRALGLGRVHVLGHAAGGTLALEHVLSGAEGVCSLVLASCPLGPPACTERLVRLRLPVLLTSGRSEAVSHDGARAAYRAISGARWVVFDARSHLGGAEETRTYLDVVGGFLDDAEVRDAGAVDGISAE